MCVDSKFYKSTIMRARLYLNVLFGARASRVNAAPAPQEVFSIKWTRARVRYLSSRQQSICPWFLIGCSCWTRAGFLCEVLYVSGCCCWYGCGVFSDAVLCSCVVAAAAAARNSARRSSFFNFISCGLYSILVVLFTYIRLWFIQILINI